MHSRLLILEKRRDPYMLRVLYVDDEPAMLRLISILFETDDEIKIIGTSSASKALELLKKNAFDLLISDYQMPAMDGITLLKELRAEGNEIPFILLTGQGRQEIFMEALDKGADICLQKKAEPDAQFIELKKAIIKISKKDSIGECGCPVRKDYRGINDTASAAAVVRE